MTTTRIAPTIIWWQLLGTLMMMMIQTEAWMTNPRTSTIEPKRTRIVTTPLSLQQQQELSAEAPQLGWLPIPTTLVDSTTRAFLATVVVAGSILFLAGSSCPLVAQAYEVRPVGGDDRSPATAALNLQAIETNNRLEREGVQLETQAEQISSLSAQLSSYSYEPTTTSKTSAKTTTATAKKATGTTTTTPKEK